MGTERSMSMTKKASHDELERLVLSGNADGEQLEEYFDLSPDQMSQLAAQWRGEGETERLFTNWYRDVIAPIGLDRETAFGLFTGEIPIEQYAASLTSEQAQRFIEMFPALQEAHQAKLDQQDARRSR